MGKADSFIDESDEDELFTIQDKYDVTQLGWIHVCVDYDCATAWLKRGTILLTVNCNLLLLLCYVLPQMKFWIHVCFADAPHTDGLPVERWSARAGLVPVHAARVDCHRVRTKVSRVRYDVAVVSVVSAEWIIITNILRLGIAMFYLSFGDFDVCVGHIRLNF